MAFNRLSDRRCPTVYLPPWTMLKTPLGSLISLQILEKMSETPAIFSLGFRIKVLPVAMATGNMDKGIIAEK